MNKDKVFIEHILQEIGKIERTLNRISQQQFREDVDIQDATLRRIEIIGEAVKHISSQLKERYPDIEWKNVRNFPSSLGWMPQSKGFIARTKFLSMLKNRLTVCPTLAFPLPITGVLDRLQGQGTYLSMLILQLT
ncbi:MAG TPA: HepT-like ribonuclease domain-containing protein [Candidatus Nanoarchaeia archaeon]|nr:HepT-like ribonuclease domain-containing protein [Candidatus Nanoarchaeia archaeon]